MYGKKMIPARKKAVQKIVKKITPKATKKK